MSKNKVLLVIVFAGYTTVLVAFFLPWGPSGPTSLEWGAKIENVTDSVASLGGDLTLASKETIEGGPGGTAKITSREGTSRILATTYSGRGVIWFLGYAALVIGLCGVTVAILGLSRRVNNSLLTKLLAAISAAGLAVCILRPARMLYVGFSVSGLFAYHAPFGRWLCSLGFVLATIGFLAAALAAALLLRENRSHPA